MKREFYGSETMKGGELEIITGELQVMPWDGCHKPEAKCKEQEQALNSMFMSTLMSLFYPNLGETQAILEAQPEGQTKEPFQAEIIPVETLPEAPEQPTSDLVLSGLPAKVFEIPKTISDSTEVFGEAAKADKRQLAVSHDLANVEQQLWIHGGEPVVVKTAVEPRQSSRTLFEAKVQDAPIEAEAPKARLDFIESPQLEGDSQKDSAQAEKPVLEIGRKPTLTDAKPVKEHKPTHIHNVRPELGPLRVPTLDKGPEQEQLPRLDLVKAKEISRYLYTEALKRLPRTVEIKVEPPELGEITVRLEKKGEAITVRFEPKSPLAVQALSQAKDDLEQSLASHGLSLVGFAVEGKTSEDMSRDGRFMKHSFPFGHGKAQPAKSKSIDDYETLTIKRGSFDYLV